MILTQLQGKERRECKNTELLVPFNTFTSYPVLLT